MRKAAPQPKGGDDLVERLKEAAREERDDALEQDFWHQEILDEAADRISSLEAALQEARGLFLTYSRVHGVLTNADRANFSAWLERNPKP